jgi:ubiquinone/menaquinone biosynthesis C-methylase UbiE
MIIDVLEPPIDYDQQQFHGYAQGRAMSPEAVAAWMAEFARHTGPRRPLTVLDLGCGTGRFTPALADTFGGPVVGVDPSARMRAMAHGSATHPAVTYLGGAAERIPLADRSCDIVLMYLVLHHVRDKPAAAAEIARVLRPDGRLLLRTTLADRVPQMLWHHYFPAARTVEEQMFPTTAEILALFGAAGFGCVTLTQSRHRIAPSLREYATRLRFRAISVFEYLSEPDIERGFAAMDADAARETVPQPVEEDCDLLVLEAG